jgi:hypothetical protein
MEEIKGTGYFWEIEGGDYRAFLESVGGDIVDQVE